MTTTTTTTTKATTTTARESELPSYLNEEFFGEALARTHGTSVRLLELRVERSTNVGNYCSAIYRATVRYATAEADATKESIVKLLVKELFEQLSDNSREYFMYTKVLPELNATMAAHGMAQPVSPLVYLAHKGRRETHIFEDLSARGYELCDRLIGYDEDEAKAVLAKLGHFHAASMLYRDAHPEIVAGMKELYSRNDEHQMRFLEQMITANVTYVAPIVESWPGCAALAAKMRANTGDTFRRKLCAIVAKEEAQVRVIGHGDLWLNNILVRRDADGRVDDAIFLDYQNCFDGSPALDIHNLLTTSVQLGVLQTRRDALIAHYHQALSAALAACDYEAARVPTLQAIRDEIARTDYMTYYSLLFPFPQTNLCAELAKSMDFAGFYDADCLTANRKDMFANKRVLDTLAYVLKRLDALGVLD